MSTSAASATFGHVLLAGTSTKPPPFFGMVADAALRLNALKTTPIFTTVDRRLSLLQVDMHPLAGDAKSAQRSVDYFESFDAAGIRRAVDCVTNPLRQMTRYETCCSRFGPGGKHLNETKVWTAHLAVRPDLKVSDRKVLEKRVGLY